MRKLLLTLLAGLIWTSNQAQNLVTNPSFEASTTSLGNGSSTVAGWVLTNYRYRTMEISAGNASNGNNKLVITGGGDATTAAGSLMSVSPTSLYQLTFDARKPQDDVPGDLHGVEAHWRFLDANGGLVRLEKSQVFQASGVRANWEPQTAVVRAPAGASRLQLTLTLPHTYPNEDATVVHLDNVSVVRLAETATTVGWLAAPKLVEPGRKERVRVKYTAKDAGTLTVSLLKGGGVVASQSMAVSSGRGYPELEVVVPANLANGSDYAWHAQLGGQTAQVANIEVNETPIITSTVAPNHAYVTYGGRIDQSTPAAPVVHWQGSYINLRFQGASLRGTFTNPSNQPITLLVVVDGDEGALRRVSVPARATAVQLTLASGLPDGNHSISVMKNDETDRYFTFLGFQLDANKGILPPKPLSGLKVEFFGDSVTSGANPDVKAGASPDPTNDGNYDVNMFRGYAAITGRALQADYRMVSKGGTGMARSFVFNYTAKDYFDLLKFDVMAPTDNARSSKWDFGRWQADVVVVAYGQNDAGRGAPGTDFQAAYSAYLRTIRARYPQADIVCELGEMAAGVDYRANLQKAVEDYRAASGDNKVHWIALYSDGKIGGSHPKAEQHRNMAYGSAYHRGLVEFIYEKAANLSVPTTGPTTGGPTTGGPAAGPIADGKYRLLARHSGKALTVSGAGQSNGDDVVQATYADAANQQWQVTATGNGTYKLVAQHSNKSLDVQNGSTANGAQVEQWEENVTNAQRWRIEPTSDGYFKLLAECSGKALDVKEGSASEQATVQQWAYGGYLNQQWKLEPITATGGPTTGGGSTTGGPVAGATSRWEAVPIVSQAQRNAGITGGEGG